MGANKKGIDGQITCRGSSELKESYLLVYGEKKVPFSGSVVVSSATVGVTFDVYVSFEKRDSSYTIFRYVYKCGYGFFHGYSHSYQYTRSNAPL